MIYGEETAQLPFSRGLWISDSPDLHEGFCSDLVNLDITPIGSVIVRPSINQALSTSYAGAVALATDAQLKYYSVPYFPNNFIRATALNPQDVGTDVPIYIAPHVNTPSGASVFLDIINHKVTAVPSQPISNSMRYNAVGYPSSNYAQYRDRIYAYWNNDKVYYVSGWNFAAGGPFNLTRTASATALAVDGATRSFNFLLDVYKDRLFLSCGNRVYYTDAAVAGGYPETWDVAAKFFDIPTRVIYRTFILNNIMYFFTSGGIYSLQALGPPESWVLKQVNNTISVSHPNACCLNKGIIYYVANNKIWATNIYSEPVEISQPINEFLEDCHGVGVFAWEDGVMVCAQVYKPSVGDATNSVLDYTRLLYFNAGGWTEYKIFDDNTTLYGYPKVILLGSVVQVPADVSNQRLTTFFTAIVGSESAGWVTTTFFVSKTDNVGNGYYTVGGGNDRIRYAWPTEWTLTPSDFDVDYTKIKRVKLGFLNVLSREEQTIEVSMRVDGIGYTTPYEIMLQDKVLPGEDDNYLTKFPVDSYLRRVSLRFRGSTRPIFPDPGGIYQFNQAVIGTRNPIEIKEIKLAYNTPRSEDQSVTG